MHINVLSFFGNVVTWHYHIRSRHRQSWACQKNDVGSYLKISGTIPAASLKKWSCTEKIIDFDQNDPFSKKNRRLRRAMGAPAARPRGAGRSPTYKPRCPSPQAAGSVDRSAARHGRGSDGAARRDRPSSSPWRVAAIGRKPLRKTSRVGALSTPQWSFDSAVCARICRCAPRSELLSGRAHLRPIRCGFARGIAGPIA